MAEEKFISIDYATWNSKYKPMEQQLAKVQAELAEERANKKHSLYLYLRDRAFTFYVKSSHRHHYYEHEAKIAVFELEKPIDDSNIDYQAIRLAVIKVVSEISLHSNMALSVARAEEEQAKFKEVIAEFDKKLAENKKLINSIPKVLRWLFKIKL